MVSVSRYCGIVSYVHWQVSGSGSDIAALLGGEDLVSSGVGGKTCLSEEKQDDKRMIQDSLAFKPWTWRMAEGGVDRRALCIHCITVFALSPIPEAS